jgi:DNA-binding transcriptional regulator GbsR (MarR family)
MPWRADLDEAEACSGPIDTRALISDISVMTEITVKKSTLAPAIERFVVQWGEMGQAWGVNRSVAQVHALLYVSDKPLTAEDIADCLSLARSNVSNSIRELMSWTLVRRVQVLGDRRDYFEAETDMHEMVRRIALGRKAREIDPVIAVLYSCVRDARDDPKISAVTRRRLAAMLNFTERTGKSFAEIMNLPPATLSALIRMGGAVARFVGGAKKRPEKT